MNDTRLTRCPVCGRNIDEHDIPVPAYLDELCIRCARALVEYERYHADGTVRAEAIAAVGGPLLWEKLSNRERSIWYTHVAACRVVIASGAGYVLPKPIGDALMGGDRS